MGARPSVAIEALPRQAALATFCWSLKNRSQQDHCSGTVPPQRSILRLIEKDAATHRAHARLPRRRFTICLPLNQPPCNPAQQRAIDCGYLRS